MAQVRAPKQWCLTKQETITSFESWRQNLQYTLSLDPNFAPFLVEGFQWERKTNTNPERGFTDDGESVPEAKRRTAAQKVIYLELMLGQIANFCPIISRNTIVKNATSIKTIWQTIRLHFGFQSTGAHFLDFDSIQLQPGERPEDLYQRLSSFIEDNTLKKDGGLSHMGTVPDEDEEITPTVENLVVLTWLRLIDNRLPALVKQRYGTELRSRTLATLKPEISLALDSLLDEIHAVADAKVMRSAFKGSKDNGKFRSISRATPSCPLCKQAGRRSFNHFLSKCKFLPEEDKRYLSSVRQTVSDETAGDPEIDQESYEDDNQQSQCYGIHSATSRRVSTKQSPTLKTFYKHFPLNVTLDTGAEINMLKLSVAHYMGVPIKKSNQRALQADGSTPLKVAGETHIVLTRGEQSLTVEALVVENLDVDLLGGIPFMATNDIMVRPAKQQIVIHGSDTVFYAPEVPDSVSHSVRRTQAFVLRSSSNMSSITWPGSYLEVTLPDNIDPDGTLAIEPKFGASSNKQWPLPQVIEAVSGKVRLLNSTTNPIHVHKNEHVCQARHTVDSYDTKAQDFQDTPLVRTCHAKMTTNNHFSDTVSVDPDAILPENTRQCFQNILEQYDSVFDKTLSGYNGFSGPFKAVVNMGPVQPPQRKGRLPQYARDKLVELQEHFDDLEQQGVFSRPEDIPITVEYLNPSFLVKKGQGGFRLVTAFADVGRYAKPQPSLMPDVDTILRTIGQWTYIIVTDLTSAFYQIPLSKESMKYCGVATPYKGIRVYTRCAMGMPGSETALEELMCRVLGDLLQEGVVAKLADDLYIGGNTTDELLANWTRVLDALQKNNLKLKPTKTIICPRSTTILGWIWSQGKFSASPHRIASLSACPPPQTVHGLRSYIGAYKVLGRVLPGCSQLIAPLDNITAGGNSSDKIVWDEASLKHFQNTQSALNSNKSIVLPRPTDQLWIVTDGSVKKRGIGATLYVTRHGKLLLAGFFSAKLRKHQVTWLPCEIEALGIAAAVKHFSPYIIQSSQQTCVLTDSKPCVQAIDKLCRGEFSASPRVTSFLSVVSRYQVHVKHLAGSANVPSDFASRNAPECENPTCQICTFIHITEDSVVRAINIEDVLNSKSRLPFTSRSAWKDIQSECPDLRRVHSHLLQGTRPSKKLTNVKDVKRYLNSVSIAKDGILVVKHTDPLVSSVDLIVVPRSAIDGLITALHIKLDHPSKHQILQVLKRHFYALDMSQAVERVSDMCHSCASLRKLPTGFCTQSSEDPPEVVGMSFAADVMKRNKQLVLVLRETSTSYTVASIVENERRDTIRDSLVCLCTELHPIHGPPAVIRVDAAPCFTSLRDDAILRRLNITLDIGRVKNVNKNPVGEKAIQELEDEIIRIEPDGGSLSKVQLAIAVAKLNCRIRREGLSARELWTQRNQFTHEQLPISDRNVISQQYQARLENHSASEKSKSSKSSVKASHVSVGDIVYLYSDKNKLHSRQRYLVVSKEDDWFYVKKFIGNQLRASSYKVKQNECFRVPTEIQNFNLSKCKFQQDNDSDDIDSDISVPQDNVHIPPSLTAPLGATEMPEVQSPPSVSGEMDTHEPDTETSLSLTDSTNSSLSYTNEGTELHSERPQRLRKQPKYLDDYIT